MVEKFGVEAWGSKSRGRNVLQPYQPSKLQLRDHNIPRYSIPLLDWEMFETFLWGHVQHMRILGLLQKISLCPQNSDHLFFQ